MFHFTVGLFFAGMVGPAGGCCSFHSPPPVAAGKVISQCANRSENRLKFIELISRTGVFSGEMPKQPSMCRNRWSPGMAVMARGQARRQRAFPFTMRASACRSSSNRAITLRGSWLGFLRWRGFVGSVYFLEGRCTPKARCAVAAGADQQGPVS